MEMPSSDAGAAIVRGMGAFIRGTPAAELPPKLKRFKRFDRPQSLAPHKAALLEALESDELTRARIAEWIDNGRPALDKDDVEVLRLATERPDGWEEALRSQMKRRAPAAKAAGPKSTPKELERAVVREKERAAKVKEDSKRARDELLAELRSERARGAALSKELDGARAEIAAARTDATAANARAESAERAAERAERKVRAAADRSVTREKALRDELRAVRRELRQTKEKDKEPARRPARRTPRAEAPPAGAGRRRRLDAPKGRLDDDPETLAAWLEEAGVHLLVDGYNVTKSEGGFGDVDLALQRRRLVDEVGKLARKKNARAIIVFDGSHVPPGTSRRPRAPVTVEYSKPGETADDHLVARLEGLPAVPVVVVTNDRELRHRTAALGATIATSDQLLALLR